MKRKTTYENKLRFRMIVSVIIFFLTIFITGWLIGPFAFLLAIVFIALYWWKAGVISKEECDVQDEMKKIHERSKKYKIKQEAEKRMFGKVKTKRIHLTKDEKEAIFAKFHYECAVCGAKEGLHIHHKDEDSSNNTTRNLTVLCGVCHKKTHMTTR